MAKTIKFPCEWNERVPAVVFACLLPGELRIIVHPGVGLADGGIQNVPQPAAAAGAFGHLQSPANGPAPTQLIAERMRPITADKSVTVKQLIDTIHLLTTHFLHARQQIYGRRVDTCYK